MRIGNGFDVHRLVMGRPLVLGGVHVPFEMGLEGHSDGDALCHAIADAILGACAMGDIGQWFPPDDPFYEGACSLDLLRTVVKSAGEKGFRLGNIDSVIICERPKLSPHFIQMRKSLSEALGLEEAKVSVKARTAEGLGIIGQSEAIAVEAVVLME